MGVIVGRVCKLSEVDKEDDNILSPLFLIFFPFLPIYLHRYILLQMELSQLEPDLCRAATRADESELRLLHEECFPVRYPNSYFTNTCSENVSREESYR